jgi:trehalose-phosphatase
VALHWRGREEKMAQEQSSKVLKKWESLSTLLEVHKFDNGIELRPKGINKGEAVKTLLKEMPANTTIAYLGDDFTDEEAFEVLGPKALKILVRGEARPTKADINIVPPDELLWFLNKWSEVS